MSILWLLWFDRHTVLTCWRYICQLQSRIYCVKMALHRRHRPLPALMKDVLAVTFSERFQQEKKLHLNTRQGGKLDIIQSFS